MWLWDDSAAPAEVAEFAHSERAAEVFLTVPWSGPTPTTRSLARTLRGGGVGVACLGSGSDWADNPGNAAAWASRALAFGDFDAVHLDIEPWDSKDWPANAERRLDGIGLAVDAVRSKTALPIEVDVPAGLVTEYPVSFARIMRSAARVTIMAYRDSARGILDFSHSARVLAASTSRPYRIGVDTRPSVDTHTTFADDGRAVLDKETATVVGALRSDTHFSGIAVHDFTHWRELRP